jgi:hypothetical protein
MNGFVGFLIILMAIGLGVYIAYLGMKINKIEIRNDIITEAHALKIKKLEEHDKMYADLWVKQLDINKDTVEAMKLVAEEVEG